MGPWELRSDLDEISAGTELVLYVVGADGQPLSSSPRSVWERIAEEGGEPLFWCYSPYWYDRSGPWVEPFRSPSGSAHVAIPIDVPVRIRTPLVAPGRYAVRRVFTFARGHPRAGEEVHLRVGVTILR